MTNGNSLLKDFYLKLKRVHMGKWAEIVPERYWSNFVCIGGAAEHIYILRKLLAPVSQPKKILVVGVFGGRDFWAAKIDGHIVTGFDLEEVADCQPTIKGDAEKKWPFSDDTFDVVIMGEVLEHLILDVFALKEAKRVLLPNGFLIGSVPFLHDENEYHVRIHNRASILSLLKIGSFKVTKYLERPGIMPLNYINYFNHFIAGVFYLFTKRSIYPFLITLWGKFEWSLGKQLWLPRHFFKMIGLINWGCCFKAVPCDEAADYKQFNKKAFFN